MAERVGESGRDLRRDDARGTTVADVTVFDANETWTVDPSAFLSKSRNTPFGGWELTGRPRVTIVDGRIVWSA